MKCRLCSRAARHIFVVSLFCNWWFVPLNPLHLFCPPSWPHPHLVTASLFSESVSLFLCYYISFVILTPHLRASLIAQLVKNPPALQETPVQFLGQEDPLEKRGRLPTPIFLGFPCGSAAKESTCNVGNLGLIPGLGRFPWRRERLPTPAF